MVKGYDGRYYKVTRMRKLKANSTRCQEEYHLEGVLLGRNEKPLKTRAKWSLWRNHGMEPGKYYFGDWETWLPRKKGAR